MVFTCSNFKVWCRATWSPHTRNKQVAWSGKPPLARQLNRKHLSWIFHTIHELSDTDFMFCEQGDARSCHLTLNQVILLGPLNIFWKFIVTRWTNLKLIYLHTSKEQNSSKSQIRHHFQPCLWRCLSESHHFFLFNAMLMLISLCRVLMLSRGFALKKLCWLEWTMSLNITEKTRCWQNGLEGAPSFWIICITL